MSWSKNRRHSYQKRQSWAEEVIAAAMMTTSGHVSFDVIPDEDLNEDDEGIVSDESPPSSNNEELYNSEKCLDATSRHRVPKEEIMVRTYICLYSRYGKKLTCVFGQALYSSETRGLCLMN